MQAGPQLLKAVRSALGLSSSTADAPHKASSSAGRVNRLARKESLPADKVGPQARNGAAAPAPSGRAEQPHPQPSAPVPAIPRKQFAASGDDYIDDFEDVAVETEADRPVRAKTGQKQKKLNKPKIVRL